MDAGVSRGCDRRLGMIGDTETGVLNHREIVGAVADGQCVDLVEIE